MLDRRTYDALERAKARATGSLGIIASNALAVVDDVCREAFKHARARSFALDNSDPAERVAECLAKWIVESNPALAEIVGLFGKEAEE